MLNKFVMAVMTTLVIGASSAAMIGAASASSRHSTPGYAYDNWNGGQPANERFRDSACKAGCN